MTHRNVGPREPDADARGRLGVLRRRSSAAASSGHGDLPGRGVTARSLSPPPGFRERLRLCPHGSLVSPAGRQAAPRQPPGRAGSLVTLPPPRSRDARQSAGSPRIPESGSSFPREELSGCRFYSLAALLKLDTLPRPLGSPLLLGFPAGSSKQLDPVMWEAPDDRVAGVPIIQAPHIPPDRCAWIPALAPPTQILGPRKSTQTPEK